MTLLSRARLKILNVVPVEAWAAQAQRPRFLQPKELSLDPCAGCVGNCCYAQVRLTTVEALRVTLTLNLPFLDVVSVGPSSLDPLEQDHRIPIPLDAGPVRFSLRGVSGHQCVFLYHVGSRGRCAIHGLRPGPCRIYPFHIQWGSRQVAVGSQTMCPVQWLQDDALTARVQGDLAAWDQDVAAEKRLVAAWIKSPQAERSLLGYLSFATRRLAKSFGNDPALVLAPPRRRLGDPKHPKTTR